MANFLAYNGFTWTFDKELTLTGTSGTYQYGTYCTGDYWVVGPATLISISPAWSGGINGAEINPIPDSDQGLTVGRGAYVASKNVARNLPRTIQAESSLICARGPGGCTTSPYGSQDPQRTQIHYAAVLTFVAQPPANNSFRPGYAGNTKTIRGTESNINYSRLARVTPTSGMKPLSYYSFLWKNTRPHHMGGWLAVDIMPCAQGANGYMANNAGQLSESILAANCDFTASQKRDLVVGLIQLGIDGYESQTASIPGSGLWEPDGGHGPFMKLAIMFAGALLDDADMLAVGEKSGDYLYEGGYGPGNAPPDYRWFYGDVQCFYVTQEDVDRGVGYTAADIGDPDWGIRHAQRPWDDNASQTSAYRLCCTNAAWGAGILAMHMMSKQGINLKQLWNNNALFDYADKYQVAPESAGWEFFLHQNSDWSEAMWNNYRAAYPPVWPATEPGDTTPPLPPTSLMSPQQDESSISLTWTAGGQASDGDYPVGYRIYRDSNLIISITGTSYTDTNLSDDTSYDYDVYSYDAAGNDSSSAASGTFSTEVIPPVITTIFINGSGDNSNDGSDWVNARQTLPATLVRGNVYYIGSGNFGSYTFDDAADSELITIKKATLADHGSETGWNPAYAGLAQFGTLLFTNTSNISFLGGSPQQTLIQHNGASPTEYLIRFYNSNNIKIDYCDINGMNGGIGNLTATDLLYEASSYIWVEHSYIHEAAAVCIYVGTADHIYWRWNRIYGTYDIAYGGYTGSNVFDLNNCDDFEVIGNLIYGGEDNSLFYMNPVTQLYMDNGFIADNIFYNNKNCVHTMYLSYSTNLRLYNNIVWGDYFGVPTGIALLENNYDINIRNNILGEIVTVGDGEWDQASIGDYNIIYITSGGYNVGSNDLIGIDPQFTNVPIGGTPLTNPTIADFAPVNETVSSVDAGVAIAEVSFDIQHISRPQGVAYDIGPFEYAGVAPSTGACCNTATGECIITTEAQCAFDWLGAGSTCISGLNFTLRNLSLYCIRISLLDRTLYALVILLNILEASIFLLTSG